MIDFTRKGTKLPVILENIEVSVVNWGRNSFETKYFKLGTLVSYGITNRHKIGPCVLAETKEFSGSNYWEIPLNTILKLAEEQGMVDTGKIIGYKCPIDIPSANVKKDDVFTKHTETVYSKHKISLCLPKELVETWEPVYEEESKVFTLLNESNTKVLVNKNGIFINDTSNKIVLGTLEGAIKPRYSSVDNEKGIEYHVEILEAKYKIGCSIVTLDEIKEIINYYKSIIN